MRFPDTTTPCELRFWTGSVAGPQQDGRILRHLGRAEEGARAERFARDFMRMLPDT